MIDANRVRDNLTAYLEKEGASRLSDLGDGFLIAPPGIPLAHIKGFLKDGLAGLGVAELFPHELFDELFSSKVQIESLRLTESSDGQPELTTTIAWKAGWKLLDGTLEVKSPQITVEIYRGYVWAVLRGTFDIGGMKLLVELDVPTLVLKAALVLTPDKPHPANAVIDHFGLPKLPELHKPDLPQPPNAGMPIHSDSPRLTDLRLLVDVRSKLALIHFSLDDLLHVGPVRLEVLKVDALHQAGSPSSSALRLAAQLRVGDRVSVMVMAAVDGGGLEFEGSTGPGQKIEIGKLIEDLSQSFGTITPPDPIADLTVENLVLSFNTATKHFFFGCNAQFRIDDKPLNMTLNIDITNQNGSYRTVFGGDIAIGNLLFMLEFTAEAGAKSFTASYLNTTNEPIDLNNLINQVSKDFELDVSSFGLNELTLSELGLTVVTGDEKMYAFRGVAEWDTGIILTGNEPIIIAAALDIQKKDKTPLSGMIGGSISTSVPYFENLKLSALYTFGQESKDLIFQLELGEKPTAKATYSEATAGDTVLTFKIGGFTFGDIITYLVSLVDPSVDDFQLDPPWDELNRIPLDAFELIINTTKKTVEVTYSETFSLGFIEITSIVLVYKSKPPKTGVDITIKGSLLGGAPQNFGPWDALDEPPPAVPGQGSAIFDLQYLGIGQHVSFDPTLVRELRTISQVMGVLRQSAQPPADRTVNPLTALQKALPAPPVSTVPTVPVLTEENPLQFNAASGWLIGAQFTVMGMLDMSIIFNDPLIYGLRIELSGEKAKKFAGLQFEILYRRISDTIGVYHSELVLPDTMRQMEFGAVSLTLPIVAIDIYTNGDFSVDFGFPWKGDFSRSFAIQAGVFTGSGGFYFSKLSAETATSVPAITNGKFNPVYEFGLGLRMGLGRSFNKGVLQAELSIQVHGILQGVVARFNPSDPTLPSDDYYIIQGGVGIVGRIYGSVDFEVIRIDVEVIARATVIFKVEAYQPALLMLEASVSVRASIKVVFVRIHFSFDLTVREEFTLGSASPTPWRLAA